MIKAIAHSDNGPVIIVGLSEGNLQQMKLGRAARVDLSDMGLGIDAKLAIFYGNTEQKMADILKEFITPETVVHVDPKLKGPQ